MEGESIMASTHQGPHALARAMRPTVTLCAMLMIAVPAGGCWQSPRMQAPFTLSNPNERHPISVKQGEALLDLPVSRSAPGLSSSQWGQLYAYLNDYREHGKSNLIIKAPTGGSNEKAAMRAYEDVRHAMRRVGISPGEVQSRALFRQVGSRRAPPPLLSPIGRPRP